MSGAPSDAELLDLLREAGVVASAVSRRPYRYATSAPLEEIRVRTEGGELELILKDLSRDRLLPEARESKPEFVYDPRRELETYRAILAPAGIGPRCFAAVACPDAGRRLLLIEKVPGVELWQVGELEVWQEVAAWIADLHARFSGRTHELRRANPYLLEHSLAWLEGWRDRALSVLTRSGDDRAQALAGALTDYDAVAAEIAALPQTFVHGELYPSNVLVVRGPSRTGIFAIDWEMAAIGPGLLDLAALAGGWSTPDRRRLVDAYRRGLEAAGAEAPQPDVLAAGLARCRLHLALQWLGWSRGWRPPPEHAHDWLDEGLQASRELGLL